MSSPYLTITPLGGLGEIGLNCQLWSSPAGIVMVDCGLMFPDDHHLGVDIIIPRFEALLREKERLLGIVLTHGHEDHIGAIPWLMQQVRGVPIYASRFTLALVENKLIEHNLMDRTELIVVNEKSVKTIGDLKFRFIPVCHSIPDGFALAVESPVGKIVHSGDFKIDDNPLDGSGTDLNTFRAFAGKEGVRLLLSDSTNVERDGHTLPERVILERLREIFATAPGRIVITLFSSHIQRIQEVFDLSREFDRCVVVSGRSLVTNIEEAKLIGLLRMPPSLYNAYNGVPELHDQRCVLLVTGAQGEPFSALTRIASGEHRQLTIHEGDTVIISSRMIPGNARAISRLINQLYRLGAEVHFESVKAIHASGHAHAPELQELMQAVHPEYFVPIHGEYRHLVKHKRLAIESGVAPDHAILLEDGDPITLLPDGIRREEHVHVESILVDGKGVGDVGTLVLRERHILGGEGMVIVVLVIDEATGKVLHGPEMISKGFVFEQHYDHLLEDAKCLVLDQLEITTDGDVEKLRERIRSSLRSFFRKILGRDPVVMPVITEV